MALLRVDTQIHEHLMQLVGIRQQLRNIRAALVFNGHTAGSQLVFEDVECGLHDLIHAHRPRCRAMARNILTMRVQRSAAPRILRAAD